MPRKYFRRRDKFLAIKFYRERYEDIRDFTKGRLYYDASEDRYLLFTHGNEFILREGDYIVESRGDCEVWSEDVFESLFEIVEGQDED